ncbi:MAG: hypothetical protein FWF67_05505 [Fibromonadales bacterium]|nr:hypothetical protein [Fibromonadales bacterium]
MQAKKQRDIIAQRRKPKTPPPPQLLEKFGEKIFIIISAMIIAFGIATRIHTFIDYRSLWLDEALLAESIVFRNWAELFMPPLSNGQSAPILYVAAVKAICSVLGNSENSLRLFSLFSFFGLLVCEWLFLKKILKMDNIKTGFVLALTAVIPSYIYYSNELKPYMSDAFFVVLALLLHAFHTQNKLSLAKLTFFYILILGFCTPAVFFIGGILAAEFLTLALARDKMGTLNIAMAGVFIIAVFILYYYWWMLPVQKIMDADWNKFPDKSLFEVFSIALVISLYLLYVKKKLPLVCLTIFYLLILGFCPPAVFFAGGILVVEILIEIFARDRKRLVPILAYMLSIAVIFGLYCLLRTQFVSESIAGFLNNTQGKVKLITEVKGIFDSTVNKGFNSTWVYAFVPFALLGIYSLVKQRNKIAYSVTLSMFFAVLASSIGKWPLNPRLWMFLPAVILIYSSAGFDFISKINNIIIKRAVFFLFLGITLNYAGYDLFLFKYGTYIYEQEVNPLIQYVKDNIKDDEKLYVYSVAVPAVKFKNGYNTLRIGKKATRNNIIYGVNREEWNQNGLGPELISILNSRKAYLLFQHYSHIGINPGLNVLQQYGKVTLVLNNDNTPLFYFKAHDNANVQDQP